MNTFLPYADVVASVQVLDNKRLGKQRVEALQLLNALDRTTGGWVHHPVTLMWRGYRAALQAYHDAAIEEWVKRGFKNTMKLLCPTAVVLPPWFGDERLHKSHRSNLLRKDPAHYGKFFTDVTPDLPYFWPGGKRPCAGNLARSIE